MPQAISSLSFSIGLRHAIAAIRRETTQRQSELQTGQLADPSLSLGSAIGNVSVASSNVSRIESIVATNKLATGRLDITQASIAAVKAGMESLAETFSAGAQTAYSRTLTEAAARNTLNGFTSALNASFNGEYVFAGINSGQPPFDDNSASQAIAEIDAAFLTHFGFPKSDPAASLITAQDFQTFLDTQVEPLFSGTTWTSSISSASDSPIRARIGMSTSDIVSVTANEPAIRDAFFAAAISAAFVNQPLGQTVVEYVVGRATEKAFGVTQQLSDLEAKAGLMQSRVSEADAQLKRISGVFETTVSKQLAIDTYESGVRLNELLNSLESTILISQRIQELSFVKLSR